MDVALVIDRLVPAAQYGGSVACNSEGGYGALVWTDERTKPTWAELLVEWDVCLTEQEYAAALAACYASRQTAYVAAGWEDPFELIEDILARGLEAVATDRQAIKDLYPLPQ